MCTRILFGALFCCGLGSAATLAVPFDQIFTNISLFDELDVLVQSSGTAFMDVSPLDLTGSDASGWTSTFLTDQHAIANGPALTGLSFLTLHLASKTDPVKLMVQTSYRGGGVRAMILSYDGSAWTLSPVPLTGTTGNSNPSGLGNPGSTGSGGNPPAGNTAVAAAPEPSLRGLAGLALLALFAGARRTRSAAPRG
jgi:hypothetical protein